MNYMLEELTDILDDLVPDDDSDTENSVLYAEDFVEMVLHLMEEYVTDDPMAITDPDFHNSFLDEICEMVMSQVGHELWRYSDDVITERLEEICEIFYASFMPRRSHPTTLILNNNLNIKQLTKKIDYLRGKPQPAQRTAEWYEFRHKLITASNAYKGFTDGCELNQLIFEKCQPVRAPDTTEKATPTMVNVDTTLHWGQKFEPLSVMIYEHKYKTTIEDFGCIQHDKYSFLGASPDGINVDKTSLRYGRMLEIKNIVNREIDGIPKKEYWIQMQLQMKVCDLDECDFLETQFIEYADQEAFKEDVNPEEIYEDDYGNEFVNVCMSKELKYKGIIIYFHTKEGKPYYVYKPLDIIEPSHIQKWEEIMLDLYQSDKYKYTYIKFIYWKLEIMSCVLVLRNRQWFEDNIWELEALWDIVLAERVSGFEHRAPNRKTKNNAFDILQQTPKQQSKCLLKFNSIIKMDI